MYQQLIVLAVMLGLFYLMIFIPENKRKKKYAGMLNALKVNDEIMTRGGIIGKVINIQDTYLIIQSGPDKARFKLDKNGIASVLTTVTEENLQDKKDK